MNNSPVGFSSSLIPFSTWSSGILTLQARIVVSQGLGWVKYLTLQDWEMDFHSRTSKPTYASSIQANNSKTLISLMEPEFPFTLQVFKCPPYIKNLLPFRYLHGNKNKVQKPVLGQCWPDSSIYIQYIKHLANTAVLLMLNLFVESRHQ